MNLNLALVLLIVTGSHVSAQVSLFLEPYTAYVLPVSNVATEDSGIGYYDVRFTQARHPEFGVLLGIGGNRWNIGVGCSYKTWNSTLESTLNFGKNEKQYDHLDLYIKQHTFGLFVNLGYRILPKLSLLTKLELNDPYSTETNTVFTEQIHFHGSFSDDGRSAGFSTIHNVKVRSSPYHFAFLEFRGTYVITNSLGLYAELKMNIANPVQIFGYRIYGYNFDYLDSPNPILFNDFSTTTEFFGLSIGASWNIDILRSAKKISLLL